VYKDKLQNCSCSQFEKNIDTVLQVELNNMCINIGGNKGSEKL